MLGTLVVIAVSCKSEERYNAFIRQFQPYLATNEKTLTGYFKRVTKVTGWNFQALVIIKDEVVTYKLRSGQPVVDRVEKRTKPLGPFQDLEGMASRMPGMCPWIRMGLCGWMRWHCCFLNNHPISCFLFNLRTMKQA